MSEAIRVVFLDVDGVLCNWRSVVNDYEESDSSLIFDPLGKLYPIERTCLLNLKRVIDTTSARIVLSTSWRLYSDMKNFLYYAFEQVGISSAVIIGQTANLNDGRGVEIALYLDELGDRCLSFVIIDDENVVSIQAALPGANFIRTYLSHGVCSQSWREEGLTEELADLAIHMLLK